MSTPDRIPQRRVQWPQRARRVAGVGASSLTALPRLGSWVVGRARSAAQRQMSEQAARRRLRSRADETLPSLYDRYPDATKARRIKRGIMAVPVEMIVGTERRPSQNTADFRPLPQLRGQNWQARWQRITRATDDLAVLPPVDLVKVGDEYYVTDGHNRVAAALDAGALEIDADVTELALPGVETQHVYGELTTSIGEGALVREAGSGRLSRTATPAATELTDATSRRDLLRAAGEDEPPDQDTPPGR